METIKNYLENMFSGLPKTEEMIKLKTDIYENMNDKYQELKADGKSENEAIGIVISEFGNIEELLEEFDIANDEVAKQGNAAKEDLPEVTMEVARDYLRVKKVIGKFVGLGVLLCILGSAALIACFAGTGSAQGGSGNGSMVAVGIVVMLIFFAGGVALFIYSGMIGSSYEYMEKPFSMSAYVKQQLVAEWEAVKPSNMVTLIIGVCMCVISPIPIIVGSFALNRSESAVIFGVCIMLLIVSFAVSLIIYAGNIMEAYHRLLEMGDYTPERKTGNKVIDMVASIVWPLVSMVYVYIGLFHGAWHPGWVIFPITGVLFGIFSAVVEGLSDK